MNSAQTVPVGLSRARKNPISK